VADRETDHRYERAQAVPFSALLLAVAVGGLWIVGQLGVHAHRLAAAQTAADATALAAAVSPSIAPDVAAANGVDAVSIVAEGGGVIVTARIDGVERVGAARGSAVDAGGLAPALVAAIGTTEAAMGRSIPIVSGYRSEAEQRRLWEHRAENPYPVAPPGTSLHERGLAIDVAGWFVPALARFGPSSGLCQPLPGVDPVHFELCRKKPSR
jgi:uncharacterized protein YcbK (DUF882 family)